MCMSTTFILGPFAVTDLLRQRTQEYEKKRIEYEEKIDYLSGQISTTQGMLQDLESLNRKLVGEIETSRKEKIQLQEHIQAATCRLQTTERDTKGQKDLLRIRDKEHESKVALLEQQLREQSDMLQEYQDKVVL
jgi:chromosome segregation ATPase